MSDETALPFKGCLPKVSNTWRSMFNAFTSVNRVYPLNPLLPKDSVFILSEARIKTRVVHLIPEKVGPSVIHNHEVVSHRNSTSEEYWFLRSKHLQNISCNCSFRRSLGNRNNDQLPKKFQLQQNSRNNEKGKLEEFVELVVENVLKEALSECLITMQIYGVENIAYKSSEVGQIHQLSYGCMHHRTKKPLIILIHGLGSTADIWNILMNKLCFKGFEVVAPDLLGHGYSSAPNKSSIYTFKNLLNQIQAVFDSFMNKEDNRKCILIGHSYGCSLITALYPSRTAKIAQLVLISGGGPTPLAPPVDINNISPYGCAHFLCRPFTYCGLKRSFFYSSRGKHFQFCEEESTVPHHLKKFLMKGQYWPEGDASFHRRILVPTLLIHGLMDKTVTLVQECEMERTIPRSFLELIPDAGHMSMLESSEHLAHMIVCFLEMWD